MIKVAALIWVMLGSVIAGSAVIAVLMMDGLAGQQMKMIPFAGIAGYVVALPVSYLIAKRLGQARTA